VQAFESALDTVCKDLAYKIVDDGEGVTHVIRLLITGARTVHDATVIAKSIANSPLCKTAWSSADPNWGRLLSAAGKAGIPFDPAHVTIRIGNFPVFAHGVRDPGYNEARCHEAMSAREFTIEFNLGQGDHAAHFLTCDLTHDYVSINADYST
jgi:glutamate N-acetyltransferase/amino-acid N-acetyltransferase